MKQPRKPPEQPLPCPVCGRLCLGHVLSGNCAACEGDAARIHIALRLLTDKREGG